MLYEVITRERKEDIARLAEHFLAAIAPDRQFTISAEEISHLKGYDWPGNVRELRNIIERSIILSNDRCVCPSKLIQQKSQADFLPLENFSASTSTHPLLSLV